MSFVRAGGFLVLSLLLLVGQIAHGQNRRYVSVNGSNDNPATATSWAASTNNLQGAINSLSATGGEVWVAKGTYKPGGNTNTNRALSFTLRSGVKVYGGFNGNETTLPPRNTGNYTTLSGELGDPASTTDNSYHVVRNDGALAAGTLLDGFVIQDGRADGNDLSGWGAGLLLIAPANQTAAVTLNNCYFARNYSGLGGGALLAYAQAGGSVVVDGTGCTFDANTVRYSGGAVFAGNYQYNNNAQVYYGNTGTHRLTLEACLFKNNQTLLATGQGGAVFLNNRSDASVSYFRRCRFMSNQSGNEAGAIYNLDGSPEFINCGFIGNLAPYGGAMVTTNNNQSILAQPKFTNCSFTGNRVISTASVTGFYGGVFYLGTRTKVNLTNSILFDNDGSNSIIIYDTGFSSVTATNTLFDQSVQNYTGTSNFPTTTTPFSNTAFLTVNPCAPVLNNSASGTTSTQIGTLDLNGSPRFVGGSADLGAVEYDRVPQAVAGGAIAINGQTGTVSVCSSGQRVTFASSNDGYSYKPYVWQTRTNNGAWTNLPGEMGATLFQIPTLAAGQRIDYQRLSYDCAGTAFASNVITLVPYDNSLSAGSISAPPLVPVPQEGNPMLNSTANATAGYNLSITWQKSEDGTTWTDVPGSNAQSVALPKIETGVDLVVKTVYFRRKAQHGCAIVAPVYSASVAVTGRDVDGRVEGKVVSSDGVTPVRNVTLTMRRLTTGLAGSPDNYSYVTTNGDNSNGAFAFTSLYWGFEAGTPNSSVSESRFVITPSYGNHVFEPTSQTVTMDKFRNVIENILFKDMSTYALKGTVSQVCTDCLLPNQSAQTGSVTCTLDSVTIRVISQASNLTLVTRSGLINNQYGSWGQTVITPGAYQIIPSYKHFTFDRDSYSINVQNDVQNLNFTTPTSTTIVGRLTAGCSDPIGQATLEFQDLPKKNVSPNVCFRKRVRTDNAGYYSIVLPARQYIVKVVSFTASPNADVIDTEVVKFFEDDLARDSISRQLYIRDVTSATGTTELNLVYPRRPTIALSALPLSPSCGTAPPVKLLEKGRPQSLTVSVYQGAVAKNCPFNSGTVIVSTNVVNDAGEIQKYTVNSAGLVSLTLVPGVPNPIAPFARFLDLQYTDKYGRPANTRSETLVVTGVKSGTAMFETVSPQLPYMVLHDPPGDNSYSYREESTTSTTYTRNYFSVGGGTSGWIQAKLGTEFYTGIGLTVPTKAWGTIGGGIDIQGGDTRGDEYTTIMTSRTRIATSGLPAFVGPEADVYYGAAQNMYYAIGTEVLFDRDSCKFRTVKRFVIANNGVIPGTEYAYTVGYIRNSIIPNLENELSSLSGVDASRKAFLISQAGVWKQLLKNNDENRRKAWYGKTISISGGVNVEGSASYSSSTYETYEWQLEINATIGSEFFAEEAGIGSSGKAYVNFKTEVGGSVNSETATASTNGFFLSDDDMGDAVAIDIKVDRAYGTPFFEIVAGKTSCPPESGTQPRDDVQFYATQPVQTGILPGTAAEFQVKLANLSIVPGNFDLSRSYFVSLATESNPDGAIITINGNAQLQNIPFSVSRGQEISLTVRVEKAASSSVFSYENLQLYVTDACGGSPLKTILLSANFKGECSPVAFLTPEPDWYNTQADANVLPVVIGGYTLAGLSKVTLEYRPLGQSTWFEGFTRTQAQLNNSTAGTSVDFNTAGLPDGQYDIRLKLNCNLPAGGVGTVYSQRLRGTIDRTPPALFGNTQPLTSTFVTGDVIGATYNEPLSCTRLKNNGSATLARLSNGQLIPITLGCATNQITLMPTSSLTPYIGEVLSVTLSGVADLYGNVKTQPDVWYFHVKSTAVDSGTGAVSLATSGGNKAGGVSSILEDAAGTIDVTFQLPQAAPNNVFVYFSVGGTARFGSDYTVTYASSSTTAQPLSATMNGNDGSIMIPKGSSSVTLKIDPVADTRYEPDETVIINLIAGGDYGISGAASATAIILNDDAQTNTIISVRTGQWEDPETWDQERVPVATDQVILDQNHTITISTTGIARKLTPRLNSRLRMPLSVSRLRLGF